MEPLIKSAQSLKTAIENKIAASYFTNPSLEDALNEIIYCIDALESAKEKEDDYYASGQADQNSYDRDLILARS